jgi:TolB-like protein/Flp pilus assembly protein TadD/DNA-binding winged helix-turn-helix (wHTH) protein
MIAQGSRTGAMASAAEPNSDADGTGYRVDDLIIDVGSQRVMRGDQEIPLPQLSFEFLLALARAAPNVLSVDQLMERVWPGLVVGPETVSQRVKLVRDALGDDSQSPRYIGGVRGRGYRMIARVSPVSPEPALVETSVSGTVTTAVTVAAAAGAALPNAIVTIPQTSPVAPQPPSSTRAKGRWLFVVLAAIGLVVIALVKLAEYRGWLTGSASTASGRPPAEAQPPKTIAVLPLIDISPGGGNEYLGDGLAEELTDRLTRIPGVRVAARTSSFAFKGKPADVREIAQSLSVRHVLEGSVRREGDRLRVTAQLIDAQSGYHVWSHSYDRKWRDLLDIQDELARSIVSALQVVLSSEIIDRLDHAKTTSLEAFDIYLAGLAKLEETSTPTQLEEAERTFQASLAIDPKFARAYAGLCETYAAFYRRTRDPAMESKAEATCNKALELDSSLREVEQALATLYVMSGRAERAGEIYKRFLARNPSDADAYIGLAQSYEKQGRKAEAEATYRRAIDAEPSYAKPHSWLGALLFELGRTDEAIEHLRRVTVLAPNSARGFSNLGGALQMAGDLEGAAQALERSLELEPTQLAYSNTGTMYFYLGRLADAEKMYLKATELTPRDYRMWANLADALYQMQNRRKDAEAAYQKAISFARLELRLNPQDADTMAALAYYLARAGQHAEARELSAKALAVGSGSVYVHYYAAVTCLEDGKVAEALDLLEKAIDLGYAVQLVQVGPEFAKLRDDKRFQRLIATKSRHGAG